MERLVGTVRKSDPGLVEELIPATLSLSDLQKILQNLLSERVPIRNLGLILETPAICQSLVNKDNELAVLTLDGTIEDTVARSLRSVDSGQTLVLEPRYAEQVLMRLASQVEHMVRSDQLPVLICAPELRRHLKAFTARVLPQLSIISMAEVPSQISLRAFSTVSL